MIPVGANRAKIGAEWTCNEAHRLLCSREMEQRKAKVSEVATERNQRSALRPLNRRGQQDDVVTGCERRVHNAAQTLSDDSSHRQHNRQADEHLVALPKISSLATVSNDTSARPSAVAYLGDNDSWLSHIKPK